MAKVINPYWESLPDADKRLLGERGQAPSAGNDWGAIVAPTIDPTKRPDVYNPDPEHPDAHSSLLSSSEGIGPVDVGGAQYANGERLVPQVTADGRIINDPDEAQRVAQQTGQHLGVYSSPDMADQAGEAMHNQGADQMRSPSYQPTMWTRADTPGARYASQEDQLAGKNPIQPPQPDQPAASPIMRGIPNDPRFADYLQQQQQPAPQGDRTARIIAGMLAGFAGKSRENAQFWAEHDAAAKQDALEQKALRGKDPRSAESQRARMAYAPLLKQMGLKDEELGNLTEADVAEMNKGGNLVEGLMRARQAAATRAQTQADELAKEGRAREEWNRQNQVTAPQRLQQSREQGAINVQGQKEIAEFKDRLEVARKAREEQEKKDAVISPQGLVRANPTLYILDDATATNAWKTGRGYTANQHKVDAAARAGAMMAELYKANDAMTEARKRATDTNGSYSDKIQAGLDYATAVKTYDTLRAEFGAVIGNIQGNSSQSVLEHATGMLPNSQAPHDYIEASLKGAAAMLQTNIRANLASIGIGAHVPTNRDEALQLDDWIAKRHEAADQELAKAASESHAPEALPNVGVTTHIPKVNTVVGKPPPKKGKKLTNKDVEDL